MKVDELRKEYTENRIRMLAMQAVIDKREAMRQ